MQEKRFDIYKILDKLYLPILLLFVGVFNLILANKYFPITEGWFHEVSMYMQEGKVMYKDFAMYIPPIFPLMVAFLTNVFNFGILGLRIYGIIERLVLLIFAWNILKRFFDKSALFLILIVSSIFYFANAQDLFYGYYQTSFLLVLMTLFFFLKATESGGKKQIIYLVVSAVILGIATYTKHTLGVIMFVFYIGYSVFLIIGKKNKIKNLNLLIFALTYVLLIGIGILILVCFGALRPLIDQLFLSSSSKGSLFKILFGFITKITHRSVIISMLFLLLLALKIGAVRYNNKIVGFVVYGLLICWLVVTIIVAIKLLSWYTLLYVAIFSAIGALMFLIKCGKFDGIKNVLIFCIASALCFILLWYVPGEIKCTHLTSLLFREDISYAFFVVVFSASIYLIVCLFLKNKNGTAICLAEEVPLYLLVFGFATVILYVHGMSGILEPHGTLLATSLFLGMLYKNNIASAKQQDGNVSEVTVKKDGNLMARTSQNVVKIVACTISLIIIFTVLANRIIVPYDWWGVGSVPSLPQATTTVKDKHLKGIKLDKNSAQEFDAIYDLINSLKKDGDTMYTFPHINYFNYMSGLKSPTFAKVHFFDVCPDDFAIADIERLKENPPTFIVYCDLEEYAYELHEEFFRNGNRSGQRDVIAYIKQVCESGEYEKIYETNYISKDKIYFYKRVV